jgi:hypothetical protein
MSLSKEPKTAVGKANQLDRLARRYCDVLGSGAADSGEVDVVSDAGLAGFVE